MIVSPMELGGDTLSEYIYSNVKKKTKGDYFPAKNSEDLIGEGGGVIVKRKLFQII